MTIHGVVVGRSRARRALAGVLVLFCLALTLRAAPDLRELLGEADFKKAGLDKLSPAELAFLASRLVEQPVVANATDVPVVAPAATVAGQPVPAAVPCVDQPASAKPTGVAPSASAGAPVASLVTVQAPGEAPIQVSADELRTLREMQKLPKGEAAFGHEDKLSAKVVKIQKVPDQIVSTIAGPFTGWEGKTIFRLTNGQVWRQVDPGVFDVNLKDPEVTITKGLMGAFFLRVKGYGTKIRVVRTQ
jgi:hypothetical protein